MTENLRISPAYRTHPLKTGFNYAGQGGFAGAVEMCNGQGACRKVLDGTMCPSYVVTRDEEHSTRGRANALRSAISGALPVEELTGKRLYDVLDLCLECKACKAECPSNVDMTKLKYEFLYRYCSTNGYPLRNRIVGNIAAVSRLGSFFAPVSNWLLKTDASAAMLEALADIDRRRTLPTFASRTFTQWFKARAVSAPSSSTRGPVVLFVDTFTNYNYPHIGVAATRVMEALDYQVLVPPTRCCGRPMLSAGMLPKARRNARFNVDKLFPYVEAGAKVVGLEPSCILSFRDDYVDLLSEDDKARAVGRNTMLIEEFVLHARETGGPQFELRGQPRTVLFHGHCHQKELVGTGPAMEVLRSIKGCDPKEIKAGCCGMAGSFGLEKEHYDISMKIGEERLFPAIRSQHGQFDLVSEGVSCRRQIGSGTSVSSKHLVELLAEAI